MKNVMHYKSNHAAQLKAKADKGNGVIQGYAAVFNNIDAQGEVIRPGAFTKSISQRVAAGKVGLMIRHMAHGGDAPETIGLITEAKEDEFGLWIKADLFDAQCAQETRAKVMDAPDMFGLSVGYKVVTATDLNDQAGEYVGRELLELSLYEVTVTALPANDKTNAEAKTAHADLVAELTQRVEALEAKASQTEDGVHISKGSEDGTDETVDNLRRRIASAKAKHRRSKIGR